MIVTFEGKDDADFIKFLVKFDEFMQNYYPNYGTDTTFEDL